MQFLTTNATLISAFVILVLAALLIYSLSRKGIIINKTEHKYVLLNKVEGLPEEMKVAVSEMSRKNLYKLLTIFMCAILAATIIGYQYAILKYEGSTHMIQTQNININSNSQTPEKININTATKDELKLLPGIGDGMAQKIIEYRSKKPFKSIYELINIEGIGEKNIKAIEGRATV